ncbi:PIG-L family deacetylase [Streptomyces sp. MS1.HAVA.3]|uniref:PIG-L family deacetylase n=1 Tax=Streptomyces caledonius TaxID=3134107 RepID=A0ABU8UCA1_9ACTN
MPLDGVSGTNVRGIIGPGRLRKWWSHRGTDSPSAEFRTGPILKALQMSLASRRTRLAALLAALTVGAAGVTTWAYGYGSAQEPAAPEAVLRPSVTEGTVLQVVAHPDDDLFFMNPDVSRSISKGVRVATVYLTAGESDGRNEAHSPHLTDPSSPPTTPPTRRPGRTAYEPPTRRWPPATAPAPGSASPYPPSAGGAPRWTSSSPGPRSTWCGCSCARPAASPATIRTASAACGTAGFPPWVPSWPPGRRSSPGSRTPRSRLWTPSRRSSRCTGRPRYGRRTRRPAGRTAAAASSTTRTTCTAPASCRRRPNAMRSPRTGRTSRSRTT